MGYAYYETPRGPAGYSVEDTCHEKGCSNECDRGLGCLCGDQPGYASETGCGWWFCGDHLYGGRGRGGQCKSCVEAWERDHPAPQVKVTAYNKGRCWMHTDGDAPDCLCALQVAYQDVVDADTADGMMRVMADRGLVVKLHEIGEPVAADPA